MDSLHGFGPGAYSPWAYCVCVCVCVCVCGGCSGKNVMSRKYSDIVSFFTFADVDI